MWLSPRVRGIVVTEANGVRHFGLSPRVRGIRQEVDDHVYYDRTIPAYAGDSDAALACLPERGGYPRPRGESMYEKNKYIRGIGLSPPTRRILSGRTIHPLLRVVRLIRRRAVRQNRTTHSRIRPVDCLATAPALATAADAASPCVAAHLATATVVK